MDISKYRKFVVALVGFAVVLLTSYFANNPPTWLGPLISLLTALGVYQVPNTK